MTIRCGCDGNERMVLVYQCDSLRDGKAERIPDKFTEAAVLPCIEGIDLRFI